jgi:hypothetical protein
VIALDKNLNNLKSELDDHLSQKNITFTEKDKLRIKESLSLSQQKERRTFAFVPRVLSISLSLSLLLVILAFAGNQSGLFNPNEREMSAKEVIEKAASKSDKLESVAIQIDMEQLMSVGEEQFEINTTINATATQNPLSMHAHVTMRAMEETFETEFYMDETDMYVREPESDNWVKYSSERFNEVMSLSQEQTNPVDELKGLQAYEDDFSIEKKDGSYTLTLTATDEKLSKFVQEQLTDSLPEELFDQHTLQNMSINRVDYHFVLDQETYYPQSATLSIDLDLEGPDGRKLNLIHNAEETYFNYNKIDEIVIPADIINKAKTMPEK